MFRRLYITLLFLGCFMFASSQHLQLVQNKGEMGFFGGRSNYIGDIAPNTFLFKQNSFGGFYKYFFNEYGGLKLNYEYIALEGDDASSPNSYAVIRDADFKHQFHDFSVMAEYYFNRFTPGDKTARFAPYLGFGVGFLLKLKRGDGSFSESSTGITLENVDGSNIVDPRIIKRKNLFNFPIQLGVKYNLSQKINLFTELSYRFTNSDKLDFMADEAILVNTSATSAINRFQGSKSGNDQFMTVKAGISINFISIYGQEKFNKSRNYKISKWVGKNANAPQAKYEKVGILNRLQFWRK